MRRLVTAYRGLHSAWRRLIAGVGLALGLAGLALAFVPRAEVLSTAVGDLPFYSLPFGADPFAPGEWKTPEGKLVNWRGVPSSRQCAECHRREFMEWNTSLHAISDLDVIYDAAVTHNVLSSRAAGEIGDQKGRWCEACHNPLGVLTGAVNPIAAVQETEALEEGVSCIVCHTSSHPEPMAGNGALTSNLSSIVRHLHPALIMAAPSRHARDMQAVRDQPFMGESGICGACHTEIRPSEVKGEHRLDFQTTFDEWRKSDYPGAGVHCQDCHMAQDPAAFIAGLKRGERPDKAVSHRFIGGNYLLTDPTLPGDLVTTLRAGAPTGINRLFDRSEYDRELARTREQVVGLLRAAADVAVEAGPPADGAVALRVHVRNTGAGHALPTGPLDQRHMWLEVTVTDAAGKEVFHSGAFDATTGRVADPDAVMWVKRMIDDEGKVDLRHILFDVDQLHYPRKPIAAGAADTVDYRVPLPQGGAGPWQVQARLWYRVAFQEILKNIEEQAMGDMTGVVIPPLLMKEAATTVAGAGLQAGAEAVALARAGSRP